MSDSSLDAIQTTTITFEVELNFGEKAPTQEAFHAHRSHVNANTIPTLVSTPLSCLHYSTYTTLNRMFSV